VTAALAAPPCRDARDGAGHRSFVTLATSIISFGESDTPGARIEIVRIDAVRTGERNRT
jgi:hypothetical protein